MRNIHVPTIAAMMVVAVVAAIGLGMVTPVKAQANNTGAALLGVAAGALLFGLLDRDSDRRCDDYSYRTSDPRCYQSGGHYYWRQGVDRRPEQLYGQQSYVPDRNRDDRYTRQWDQQRGQQVYSQQSGGRNDRR
jgi:outer membrane scaffolding protein for murein synthesis (MipA/OmpV family)